MENPDFEDEVLSQSIKGMPSIEVPSVFLPNVMFQVYEQHHRDKIHLPLVGLFSLLLFLLSFGFFVWDVQDYARANNLVDFQQALTRKIDTFFSRFDELFSALGGIISASWQIVTGAIRMFIGDTPLVLQALIVSGLLAIGFLARKWYSSHGKN